jgi:iron complex outermembrane receptor protein
MKKPSVDALGEFGVARHILTLSSAALIPMAALAANLGDSNQPEGGLQEIVVTAEKRESTLQNTPMSISAFGSEQLLTSGVTNIEQIAQQTPGLAFESTGPSRSQFSIRGMSSNGGAAPTVGFYLDETPITPPIDSTQGKNFVDPDLYDLARVEVLRGPQGTLYGASSMGGTIRFITNQPNLIKFEASARAVLSGTADGGINYTTSALLNVPLIDNAVAFRLIATEKHNDGFIDRVVQNAFPLPDGTTRGDVTGTIINKRYSNVNSEDTQSTRMLVTIAPTGDLTITPSVFYQDVAQSGENTIDSPPGTYIHYQPFDTPEPFHDRFALSNVLVKYKWDGAQLTSSTSYIVISS